MSDILGMVMHIYAMATTLAIVYMVFNKQIKLAYKEYLKRRETQRKQKELQLKRQVRKYVREYLEELTK